VDTEFSLKFLCEFIDDGISPVTRGNWQGFSRNARTIKKAYYKADTTVSVIIYRIMISNSNEDASYGEKENAVTGNADANIGSSDSELAYPSD